MDNSLLLTARDISGHLIQYDDDEVISSLVVNVQTASLAPLLNPDTKEIAKSESNKIQQVEANVGIYLPNNRSMDPLLDYSIRGSCANQQFNY